MKVNFVESDYLSAIPHLSLFHGVPTNEFPNTFLSNCLVTTSSIGEFDVKVNIRNGHTL